ncbi:zinc finger CCCH domain-containing protein 28-like isoform X1 [Iris pallida]|uniref:Zinc finger CCCH domain-containing protein 28-like isoform X1 n=1 Tax=Iris pallida TaxID=29817 RepID=A0AAX6ETJ0_IRIPA|nr:zinc finger CCCH domain-containing protein 28-like isoform X1 [Iris pallida]
MSSSYSPSPTRKRVRSPTPSSPSSTYNSNDPDSDGDRDDRTTSAGSGKRRRGPSAFSDIFVEVCKDFVRGGCRRAEIDCKFAHPHSAVSILKDKVVACVDSLRNKCFRGRSCKYYHPPAHIQESLLKSFGVEDPKVPEVCKDFIRGRCLRTEKDCRFAHQSLLDQHAIVCLDFIHGRCERKSCRYSHVLVPEITQRQVCQDFLRGRCERNSCRYSHVLVPEITQPKVCQDFMRGRCERRSCRYIHILAHDTSDKEILQVCRDFLKKMCNRDSCKFAHPDTNTKVIDYQVEVCRDFQRGICDRTVCRFYHPVKKSRVESPRSSYIDRFGSACTYKLYCYNCSWHKLNNWSVPLAC